MQSLGIPLIVPNMSDISAPETTNSMTAPISEMTEHLPDITDAALPRAFQVCDAAAQNAQTRHLRLLKMHIWMGLVLASVSQMLYGVADALTKPPLSLPLPIKFWLIPLGVGVLLTLGTRFFLRGKQWEKIWYKGRAAAEQLRSRAWCYMMGVDPREPDAHDEREFTVVRDELLADIDAIKHDWAQLGTRGVSHLAELSEITPQMDAVRALAFDQRVEVYLTSRIQSQVKWFENRSVQYAWRQRKLLWLTELCELGAAVFALLLILDVNDWFRVSLPVPISWTTFLWPCLTGAAAGLAWMGFKRYQELSYTYGANAEELISIKQRLAELVGHTPDWPRMVRLVKKCEDILTRENQTWFLRCGG